MPDGGNARDVGDLFQHLACRAGRLLLEELDAGGVRPDRAGRLKIRFARCTVPRRPVASRALVGVRRLRIRVDGHGRARLGIDAIQIHGLRARPARMHCRGGQRARPEQLRFLGGVLRKLDQRDALAEDQETWPGAGRALVNKAIRGVALGAPEGLDGIDRHVLRALGRLRHRLVVGAESRGAGPRGRGDLGWRRRPADAHGAVQFPDHAVRVGRTLVRRCRGCGRRQTQAYQAGKRQ
jgi:hypothetical protein